MDFHFFFRLRTPFFFIVNVVFHSLFRVTLHEHKEDVLEKLKKKENENGWYDDGRWLTGVEKTLNSISFTFQLQSHSQDSNNESLEKLIKQYSQMFDLSLPMKGCVMNQSRYLFLEGDMKFKDHIGKVRKTL